MSDLATSPQAGDSLLARRLAAFLPATLVRDLGRPGRTDPSFRTLQAAVVFADVSGFSRVTTYLADRGPEGVEQLNRILGEYFGRLLERAHAHGGDAVKFAGDGVLFLFDPGDGGLDLGVRRAAAFALAVRKEMSDYRVVDDIRLSMHLAVGAGQVLCATVGGLGGSWHFTIAGDAVLQLAAALRSAEKGDVVLSAQAAAVLGDSTQGEWLDNGARRVRHVSRRSLELAGPGTLLQVGTPISRLQPFVPRLVCDRLAAGLGDWLSELRRVSVLFVNVVDFDHTATGAGEFAQDMMLAAQEVIERREGFINQLLVDDKGVSLIAIFGVPPLAHEDDAARCVQAAREIEDALAALGQPTASAVTTGRAFCGPVGTEERREYTVIGAVVNLAAGLMSHAGRGLVCDRATVVACRSRFEFAALEPVAVKGHDGPTPVFRVLPFAAPPPERKRTPFVGRKEEMRKARALIRSTLRGGRGTLVVEGDAGVGKSRFLAEIEDEARQMGLEVLRGGGDPTESATPYFAWRRVLMSCLGVDAGTTEADQHDRLVAAAPHSGLAAHQSPLLAAGLGLPVPETDFLRTMSAEARADTTRRAYVALIGARARESGRGLVVALEDCHWLDSQSWALLLEVCRAVPRVLVVASLRHREAGASGELSQVLHLDDAQHLFLGPLADGDCLEVVTSLLGVDALPAAAADLIKERAEGNPFFAEELGLALRDAGLMVLDGSTAHMADQAAAADLRALTFAGNVESVVTTRVDRLGGHEQLTLKVASVIGRTFALPALVAAFPVSGDPEALLADMEQLSSTGLIESVVNDDGPTYAFRHAITQNVAYGLLPFVQRRQLHANVAHWLEQRTDGEQHSRYSLLAHHWELADQTDKAVHYLEASGLEAVRQYANVEVIQLFARALALSPDSGLDEQGRIRRASWERYVSNANNAIGETSETRPRLRRAMALLGMPEPAGRRGVLLASAREAFIQGTHRAAGPIIVGRARRSRRERYLEAARSAERLSETYYREGPRGPGVLAALRCLNVAEAAGRSPELARAYMATAMGLHTLGRQWVARSYARRALAALSGLDDEWTRAWVYFLDGAIAYGVGEWQQVVERMQQAQEIWASIGEWRLRAYATNYLATMAFTLCDFPLAWNAAALSEQAVAGRGVPWLTRWVAYFRARVALRQGDLELARFYLAAGDAVSDVAALPGGEAFGREGEVTDGGRVAWLEYEMVAGAASRANDLAIEIGSPDSPPTIVVNTEGHYSIASARLAWLELGAADSESGSRNAAPSFVRTVEGMAKMFPSARPRAHLLRGRLRWLDGDQRRALAEFRTASSTAVRLGMPFDEALAEHELARRLPPSDRARARHRERSVVLFDALGVRHPPEGLAETDSS